MRIFLRYLRPLQLLDKWWVLDVGGNRLRMIACIRFRQNRLFVKHIVTHAEYDRLCDRYRRGDL
jgi:mRNA interferase HigB